MNVLVPVDNSANSLRALRRVAEEFARHPGKALEVQLLNVRPAFSRHIARFMKRRQLDAYQQAEAERALRPARKLLEQHGIAFTTHVETGRTAEVIAGAARRLACDHIVMGTSRKNSLLRMIEDSVTNKVMELASVPVEVVPGSPLSKLYRYGIPAVIGAALGLMLLAAAD